MQKLFSMRTDNNEGAEFLEILDRLRWAQRPVMDRTTMVKKLVFEARAATEKRTADNRGRTWPKRLSRKFPENAGQ